METHLRQLIAQEGPIPLDRFMAEALYHPRLGYYNRKVPIGKEGDYITAPEMTQVFGEVLGLWCCDQWEKHGRPDLVRVIDLGPGRGTLMADLLRAIQVIPAFAQRVHVHLVDVSSTLKDIQNRKLASFSNIEWHDSLADVPPGVSFVIANEFFDALPIKQFIFQEERWFERFVGVREDSFEFVLAEGAFYGPQNPKSGDCIEFSPSEEVIVKTLANRLKAGGGAALIIDYGFTDEFGIGDSLQALKNHRYHPIFEDIGQADLTHHVNFGRLKHAFESLELRVEGPVFQGDFLKQVGLDLRTEQLCRTASSEQAGQLRTAAARLISPSHMGHLFKVLSVYSDACDA